MRHHDDRGRRAVDEPLELVEPREVEVVGGLVEQQHVLLRQQDRRERRPRGLPTAEVADGDVEPVGRQPDLGEHRAGAGIEVVATEREVVLERLAVGDDRLRVVARARASRRRARSTPPPRRSAAPGRRAASRPGPRPAPAAGSPTVVEAGDRETDPASGCSRPASTRSSVDFPIPFGPTTPSRAPGFTVTDTPPSTTCAPWWRCTSLATSTSTDATGPPLRSNTGGSGCRTRSRPCSRGRRRLARSSSRCRRCRRRR